ncbi:hypothetical protein SAMN05216436_10419 [bacterium A37T11]|nr:hypothetical protein SAMN05216436_10419 [bacterium A37T11]
MKLVHKKFDKVTEHYLVPIALLILNVSIVHTIFFAAFYDKATGFFMLILTAPIFVAIALILKYRITLLLAIAYYLVLFLLAF